MSLTKKQSASKRKLTELKKIQLHSKKWFRFFQKVQTDPKTNCWLWVGAKNGQYGRVVDYNTEPKISSQHLTHRYIFFLIYGRMLHDSVIVRHKCLSKNCCNPSHLELGTAKENSDDRSDRTRVMNHDSGDRSIVCKRGHEYTVKADAIKNKGCPKCRNLRQKELDRTRRLVLGN